MFFYEKFSCPALLQRVICLHCWFLVRIRVEQAEKKCNDVTKKNKIWNPLSQNKMSSLNVLFIVAVNSTLVTAVESPQWITQSWPVCAERSHSHQPVTFASWLKCPVLPPSVSRGVQRNDLWSPAAADLAVLMLCLNTWGDKPKCVEL